MGVSLLEFPTPDEAIAAVRNGEADAVLADKAFLVPYVTDSNGALAFIGEDVLLGGGIGIGLRQSDTELREKLDGVITAMKADGSLNALITKWFGPDQPIFE
jgi:polar amino acid transport system substrate-binding protein